MKKQAIFAALLFSAPLLASAQQLAPLQTLIQSVGRLVAMLIPILITVALIVFFWGLIKYIRGAGKSAAAGKSIMIAGIVSLFVMVSIWGIIALAQNALGVNANSQVQSPGVPVPGGAYNTGTTPVPYTGSNGSGNPFQ